jgi:predicted nuclease of restriction endonuclease-like (RecB) superfamily
MLTNDYQYRELLTAIKDRIRSSQAKAALSVNSAVIQLYWNIGEMIVSKQALFEGRNSYIEQLSADIKSAFPDLAGFSRRNLFDVRRFYLFYNSISVQQLVALGSYDNQQVSAPSQFMTLNNTISLRQLVALGSTDNQQVNPIVPFVSMIPWGHHLLILNKVKDPEQALFYIQQTIEHNWSRAILTLQIEQNLFARQGKALNNFKTTLPEEQALIAQQMLKDPYNFGFLTLEPQVQELELEKRLTEHITKFLLELGKGFAFIGRQYPLELDGKEYRIDLLFYHIRLRSFVVIDLKTGAFEPEFTGKMNFYLSVIDDQLKQDTDQPSIGIILCKGKKGIEVEYALRGITKPIGISEFNITQALPAELKSNIPTIEEFENELNKELSHLPRFG